MANLIVSIKISVFHVIGPIYISNWSDNTVHVSEECDSLTNNDYDW